MVKLINSLYFVYYKESYEILNKRQIVMLSSTISSKGQTTLPKPIRQMLGIKAGDKVNYLVFDGEVRIVPVRPIGRLFGVLKCEGPAVSLEEMEQAIAEGACEQ